MTEAEIKVMIAVAYRAGLKDGWNGKDPCLTLKQADEIANTIYLNAMMAKQEETYDELRED